MKISLLSENITPYIALLGKTLPSRPQIPILANIMLIAGSDGLILKATDMELGVEVKIPAKIDREGSITIPGKEFLETISSFPKDKMVIEYEKELVVVSCRASKVQFNTISSEEFPQLYKAKGSEILRFSKEEFDDCFSSLTFSVSIEETRPQLSGVYLDKKNESINFVSTDGYRMSIKKVVGKKLLFEGGLVISVGLVNEVLALKDSGEIILSVNSEENQVVFETGNIVIVGRMIAGAFPDYEKVIPQDPITSVIFDREEFLQSVKLASVFAKENTNIIAVGVVGDKIKLATKTQGVGEGEVFVDVKRTGEDNSIAFNIKYLMDVLKNIKDKELEMQFDSSTSPALFSSLKKDFMHVIMPIQVE